MPLQVRITATESASSGGFNIADVTGSYNSVTNPFGYGGGVNPDIADILTCVATITKPDPVTFLPSTDPALTITKNVYYGDAPNVLPNTTGILQFISAVDDLGYAETMQNGIYAVYITETDIDTTYISNTYYMLVYNSLVCCITKPYLTVNLDECGSCLKRDTGIWNIIYGKFIIDGVYWAWFYESEAGLGDFSKTAEYLIEATAICNDCNSCGC